MRLPVEEVLGWRINLGRMWRRIEKRVSGYGTFCGAEVLHCMHGRVGSSFREDQAGK